MATASIQKSNSSTSGTSTQLENIKNIHDENIEFNKSIKKTLS